MAKKKEKSQELDLQKVQEARQLAREAATAAFDKAMAKVLEPLTTDIEAKEKEVNRLAEELNLAEVELANLKKILANAKGESPKPTKQGGTKRVKRTQDEMVGVANEIVRYVEASGKEGRGGKEIKEKFGTLLPSVKGWVEKYGGKLRTEGAKRSMRYFVD